MADIIYTVCCAVRRDHVPADDTVHFDRDVVFGLYHLPWYLGELNFDVNDADLFGADVDVDQSRVDGFVELPESRDQTDGSLLDVLERVGERAAWDHSACTDTGAEGVHHGSIETVLDTAHSHILSIGLLHLLSLKGLDCNDGRGRCRYSSLPGGIIRHESIEILASTRAGASASSAGVISVRVAFTIVEGGTVH